MKITVVIPAYKADRFVKELIDSIDQQTHKDFEVLIGVDNCEKTLKAIPKRDYLKVFMFPKVGAYVIKNTLAEMAESEMILFFDADDTMNKTLLSNISKAKADHVRFKSQNGVIGEGVFAMSKELFLSHNGFWGWQCAADTEFKYRVAGKFYLIGKPMFYYRQHPVSLTNGKEYGFGSDYRNEKRKIVWDKKKPDYLTTNYQFKDMRKKVSINMATYPLRQLHLSRVIDSLLPQCDVLRIYLNEYNEVPKCCIHPKIEYVIGGENLKDTGKFYWAGTIKQEYYFTVDDDFIYHPEYVKRHIEAINKHNAVVCSHGKTLKDNPLNYHDIIRLHTHFSYLGEDIEVNYVGTGTVAFDNSKLAVDLSIFEKHGMTDEFFTFHCRKNEVPMICRAHDKDELGILWYDESLWATSRERIPDMQQLFARLEKI
jgi:hypothetical protein